jgi:cytochrome oxidase Cu insertion factor (SCO1/SenC/PrrC family)
MPYSVVLPIRLVLLVAFSSLFLCSNLSAQDTPPILRPFKFYDLTGKPFTNANLKPNTALIAVYFSPDCDHCQQQAKWIQEKSTDLKNCQLLWITDYDEPAGIKEFQAKYLPKVAVPMYFVQDKDYKIDSYFGYSEVPSIYIYTSKGQLATKLRKETPVSGLIPHIK